MDIEMPGYFKKAPLTYVIAKFSCSRFPELDSQEKEQIRRAMINIGYPDYQVSEGEKVDFNMSDGDIEAKQSKILRAGFFSADRKRCLLLTPDSIEYRVSDYLNFEGFCDQLDDVLKAIFSAIPEYTKAAFKEAILSYSDTIIPEKERSISNYFKEDSILPLNFLQEYDNDVQQVGQTQATRIVRPNLRLNISLEQIPVINKQINRWLPQQVMELDQKLSMPLNIFRDPSNIDAKYYGILLLQGGRIVNKTIEQTDIIDIFSEIRHELKMTFSGLINKDVCEEDWEYVNT